MFLGSVFPSAASLGSRLLLSPASSSPNSASGLTRFLSADAMARFKYVEVRELSPFVYSVYLNRPDKKNAISFDMWE